MKTWKRVVPRGKVFDEINITVHDYEASRKLAKKRRPRELVNDELGCTMHDTDINIIDIEAEDFLGASTPTSLQTPEQKKAHIARSRSIKVGPADQVYSFKAAGWSSAGGAAGQRLDDQRLAQVARSIFSAWDLDGDGVLTAEEIVNCSDEAFASLLVRMLRCDNEGKITCESLLECLRVLHNGDLEAKVKLFVRFVDVTGSGSISYDAVQPYLAELGQFGAEFLGFGGDVKVVETEGQGQGEAGAEKPAALTADDMVALFRKSVRGDAAIAIFCSQILRLLHARTPEEAAATARRAHHHSSSILPPVPKSVSAQVLKSV
jgi:hypothetical protein